MEPTTHPADGHPAGSQPAGAPADQLGCGPWIRPVVVFDFDGTLADTAPAIVRTARQALSELGMSDAEMGDLRRLIGPPFPLAFTLVFGMGAREAEQVTGRYRELFDQLPPDSWPLFDGVPELLRALKAQGRRLAVASSRRDYLVRAMLQAQGMLGLFDAVHGSGEKVSASKAHLIGRCLDDLGAAPGDAVMVGDRHFDVESAAELGVPCVGVTYAGTGDRAELEQAGAAAVAASVDELAALLLA